MNIVLIGMRGSGKTTIGKILADGLSMKFIESDSEIEKESHKKISQFVDENGWKLFRDLEEKIVTKISLLDNCVISTGGGVILQEKNVENLKNNGFFVFLKTRPSVALQRIKDGVNRPKLTDKKSLREEIKIVYKTRRPLYEKAADLILDASFKKPEVLAQIIVKKLKSEKLQ